MLSSFCRYPLQPLESKLKIECQLTQKPSLPKSPLNSLRIRSFSSRSCLTRQPSSRLPLRLISKPHISKSLSKYHNASFGHHTQYNRFFFTSNSSLSIVAPKQVARTIYALSTPFGVSGLSVIRISGPSSRIVLEKMTRIGSKSATKTKLPTPRVASFRKIIVPHYEDRASLSVVSSQLVPGELIDEGLVVFFEGPRSHTGEDLVELYLHGSISVIRDTLESISLLGPDFKHADPGDFTRRAWLNGKIEDLTRLEAISDLIHSETREQRKQALEQMQGHLGKLYDEWTVEIHTCLAHLEALVDFGHDELLDDEIASNVTPRIIKLIENMKMHLSDKNRGEMIRNGITVCLVGRPNAGKSSLLNTLSKSDAAIVSPEAGTTRDIVETRLDLMGFPVILQDTAGLNNDENIGFVERQGISRALSKFNEANIKMVVLDQNDENSVNRDQELIEMVKRDFESTILVLNKADLKLKKSEQTKKSIEFDNKADHATLDSQNTAKQSQNSINQFESLSKPQWVLDDPVLNEKLPVIHISCADGFGVDQLMSKLESKIKDFFAAGNGLDGPSLTRQRHRENLRECVEALQRYIEYHDQVEIAAEELRLAGKSISRITGKVDVEQILDIVFRDFCIGK